MYFYIYCGLDKNKHRHLESGVPIKYMRIPSGPFSILLTTAILFVPSLSASKTCGNWRGQFKKRGILLPAKSREALIKVGLGRERPQPSGIQKKIIRRYRRIRWATNRVRRCYLRQYLKAQTENTRNKILFHAEQTARQILEEAVLPLWIGTPWHYYGTATYPHQKKLACGYFLVHALKALGFKFPENFYWPNRRRRRKHIYEYAKLSPTGMVKALSSPESIYTAVGLDTKKMLVHLRKQGPGIYILGLDNHVGLVLFDGTQAAFWHSNFLKNWVNREDLFKSLVATASMHHILGKLRPEIYRWWLFRFGIYVKRPDKITPLHHFYRNLATHIRSGRPLVATTYVALCDNSQVNCGTNRAGAGDKPNDNLYWGTRDSTPYVFNRSRAWKSLKLRSKPKYPVLAISVHMRTVYPNRKWRKLGVRRRFKFYHVALAYQGKEIALATLDFVRGIIGKHSGFIRAGRVKIPISGSGHVLGYIGHNHLLDNPHLLDQLKLKQGRGRGHAHFIFACKSGPEFGPKLNGLASANLLYTKTFMYPGAFLALAILDGIAKGLSRPKILKKAAWTYYLNQKRKGISLRGARTVFQ